MYSVASLYGLVMMLDSIGMIPSNVLTSFTNSENFLIPLIKTKHLETGIFYYLYLCMFAEAVTGVAKRF